MKKFLVVFTAIAMLLISTVTAFAAESPTAPVHNKVVVDADKGGTANSDVTIIQKGDEVTLIAKPDDGYGFNGWEIDGDYEIVSGDLNSTTLVIRAKSDIHAKAAFKSTSSSSSSSSSSKPVSSGTSSQGKPNNSDTSPVTGSESVVFFGIAALALIPVAVFAKKRLANKD